MYGRKGREITSVVLLLKVETDLGRVSIVVVDREEQHDAQDWCWQHGQQVWLKAPHILDRPLVRDPEFPQEQVHHLQRRVSLQVVHHYPCKNKQTNLWVRLQWQPSLFLGHFCLLQRKVCFQISMYMISYLRELRGNLYALCTPKKHR